MDSKQKSLLSSTSYLENFKIHPIIFAFWIKSNMLAFYIKSSSQLSVLGYQMLFNLKKPSSLC